MSEELILDNMDNSHVTVKQEDSISLPDLELVEEFMFADNLQNEDNQVNSQTVKEPEQSEDQPLTISDTSESEKDSDSDDNQPTMTIKREHERKQNANEPIPPCENTEDFVTEYLEDQPLSISDSSESEKGSDTDDNQLTTAMKRKRRQTSAENFDAVIAKWKPRLECVVCKKSLPNFPSLSAHFRHEHPNERCRVECCSRRFYHRYLVAKHAGLHFNPDKVKCRQCDSYYASRTAMYVHMNIVHSTANIGISDKIGNSKLRSKSSIGCVICKTSCAEFYLLKEHYRLQHPTKVCYALCCERKFYKYYEYESHMQLHRDPNAFKCKICCKRLSRPDTLQRHMRQCHSNIKTADP